MSGRHAARSTVGLPAADGRLAGGLLIAVNALGLSLAGWYAATAAEAIAPPLGQSATDDTLTRPLTTASTSEAARGKAAGVSAQQAADAPHARLRELEVEYGRPTREGGWTDEQNAAWGEAWSSWRDAAEALHEQVTSLAQELDKPRSDVEAALKQAARHSGAT
ncbi:hypothetical protein [Streptomyces kanasensis]|uniref:hypothetical protein n=1 Tax=Streptomyces kanasensis TaxID=936756 RepID=UPI0037F7FB8D